MKLCNKDIIALIDEQKISKNKLSQNKLIELLSFIPYSITEKYKRYGNYSDLLQCAHETLWKSIVTFDSNKSDNFFYWAYLWIKQAVAKEALKEKEYLADYPSIDCYAIDFGIVESAEEYYLAHEERQLISSALFKLNKKYQQVLEGLYEEELSLRALSKQIGISHESVRNLRDVGLQELNQIINQQLNINNYV